MDIANIATRGLNHWKNQKVRQIAMLFSVSLATMPIGIVISVVLSRYLGPDRYGDYQFLDNLFNLAALFFTLGFFYAANRALVLNNNPKKAREYFGAALVVLLALFLLLSISLTIFSLYDPNLKLKHLNKILLFSIPFGWVYLASNYFETLFQADNRMKLLSISRLLPKIGFLIAVGFIYFILIKNAANKLEIAWGLYILTQVFSCLFVFVKIKMSFKNLKSSILEIWRYNKIYGRHVYAGSVFSVGVAYFSSVLISYFGQNNSGVGYYALALSLSNPLQFIPNTIAVTNYKEFSNQARIPRKLTRLTILLTISSLVGLWVITPFFVTYFYSGKFQPVIFLTFITSIGVACGGLADYYNRFIGAHGHGKLLRNTAFIVGMIILLFNLIFIPRFGATGAAITRLSGGVSYLLCMLYYYRKSINKTI